MTRASASTHGVVNITTASEKQTQNTSLLLTRAMDQVLLKCAFRDSSKPVLRNRGARLPRGSQ